MRQPLKINAQTCLISIVSATAIALSFFSSLVVLRDGTVVLAQIFSTAGLIVPCLAGRFLFDEKISYVQFGGLIVLMFASSLMVTHNRDVKGRAGYKLYLALVLLLISNGTIMLSQKMFGLYVVDGNIYVFSFLTFSIASLLMTPLFILFGKNTAVNTLPEKLWFYAIILAASVLSINVLITTLSKEIPAIILFPLFNGMGLILTSLMSSIVFKEKLTVISVLGLLAGVAGLVMVNVK